MKPAIEDMSSATRSILPLLDTFTSTAIAIVGCHTAGISRETCEYDLLVLGKDIMAYRTVKVGDFYVDVQFKDADEFGSADPEFLASIAGLVPARDTSLVLGSAKTSAKKGFQKNCRAAASGRLTLSLKSLGRASEALERNALPDADFWLLVAGYDFGLASLFSRATVPSPSHIFSQLKQGQRPAARFRDWSDAVGLALSSRAACENRVEGLSVLYDFLRSVSPDTEMLGVLSRYRSNDSFELLKRKSAFLADSMQSVDSYAYLGLEVVSTLADLAEYRAHELRTEPEPSKTIEFLGSGKDRLIAQDVFRLLGLVRPRELLSTAAERLRDSVSVMARQI